ncbi:MAG: hypothetical protein A3H29_04020 [Acidobacteria bacterium RIFCSPLOWO2_02_FULL_67_21]|nr:MAG: hypothetical protein A3H29_04020 [Acidobacteria bacterium RIFCSPLOWO2_02_FULL_67_21]
MKILFFMRSTVYVRNFESTLRLLAERGHRVHVAAEQHEVLDPTDLMGRLARQHSAITYGPPPVPRAPHWAQLGIELRKADDALRYLGPEYRNARKLRLRAELTMPVFLQPPISRRLVNGSRGRRIFRRLLRSCDRAIPPDAALCAFIREHRPDIVAVTPLVEPGSPQSEYLRAARAVGVPTALCVYSWDNLTSKGLIHDPVDVVTVWNDAMKEEATTLHDVPGDRVVVTGAAAYDHWFTWKSRTTREAFCGRVGLDPRRPYLLYLCSSKFIARNEVPFVRRWIHEIREASGVLRGTGVLVRPHPQNLDRWDQADFTDLDNVAIWPRTEGNPTDEDKRAGYYDSIANSAAVVGINTSALIESAIVGRGVYTLLAPEFRDTQEGTLHFRHLRSVNGGMLNVASDLQEHVSQLEAALADPAVAAEKCRRFVEAFVRPHGLGEPAAPRMAAALEATAARGVRRTEPAPWWAPAARPVLRGVAAVVEQALNTADQEEERRRVAKRLDQEQRAARERAAAAEAAAAADASSRAFDHYVRVREEVRRQRQALPPGDDITACERQMLAALEPLWDASPETIATLRRHAAATNGVPQADVVPDGAMKGHVERDLRRLLSRGDERLWIDEPAVLGSVGFKTGGRRYSHDTLRYFRMISLLQDAALIDDFRSDGPRRTVWEIGGGWGGFAHHFKTVCPDVTYLITGRPEQFLVSAVYLMTMFPGARFRFYDPANPDAFWNEWASVDFAFAPEPVVPGLKAPSIDLAVDVMALECMSPDRLNLHVQRAYDLHSRYFLSVQAVPNGDGGPAVSPALEHRYWTHPVCAPESLARRLSLWAPDGRVDQTYFLGWRRLRL